MKFKVGQTVYYYQATGQYQGEIIQAVIVKAIKDLSNNKIVYTVKHNANCWLFEGTKELTADYLYSSKKKIEKEYKEEIIYNNLQRSIASLENTLTQVYTELIKDAHKDFTGITLSINGEKAFNTVCVSAEDVKISGIGSVKEEIDKLKKEVAMLKNKIKPKTKKSVVKKADNDQKVILNGDKKDE